MGLIRNLLGRTLYPDNYWTRNPSDGSPLRPYDSTTHTMAEYMGVRVDPSEEALEGNFTILTEHVKHAGSVASGASGHVLDGRLNDGVDGRVVGREPKDGDVLGRDVLGRDSPPMDGRLLIEGRELGPETDPIDGRELGRDIPPPDRPADGRPPPPRPRCPHVALSAPRTMSAVSKR